MTPLMYQELSGGRTRYLSGGFTTYKDAKDASDRMIRLGFRASVVAFADGKPTTTAKAKVLEAETAKVNAGEKGYSIEIIPAELRLPTSMRETITSRAPGKTIIRRSSGSDVIYSISGFATRTEAEALSEALRNQPNVKIRVIEL